MISKLYLLHTEGAGAVRPELISPAALDAELRKRNSKEAVMVLPGSEGATRSVVQLVSALLRRLPERKAMRQEKRIDELLDVMLDMDPLSAAETRIDVMNAEMRCDFLNEFPMLDAAMVHERAGHEGSNKSQTAAAWRRAGRIFGVPVQGKTLFPAFQFDADGQPLALLKPALQALPPDLSAWQRAFWLVSPNEWTRGVAPIELIRRSDKTVIDAARREAEIALG